MPIRRAGIQPLLGVSHALVAVTVAVLALSACSGSSAARSKFSTPARYDAVVFMCPSQPSARRCAHAASPSELATVRNRLLADPAVRAIAPVSTAQAYRIARRTMSPTIAALLHPGDLFASFSVTITIGLRRFARTYLPLPGVFNVLACTKRVAVCQISQLRAVGVIH